MRTSCRTASCDKMVASSSCWSCKGVSWNTPEEGAEENDDDDDDDDDDDESDDDASKASVCSSSSPRKVAENPSHMHGDE